MFDQLKNLSGLAGMLKDADRIKEQFAVLQDELARHRIEAETGGGAVKVTVNGSMHVISINIDQTMLSSLVSMDNEDDRLLAQELIAGAVNAAMEKAKSHVSQEMAKKAQDMGLPIPPGADMSQLLGGMGAG